MTPLPAGVRLTRRGLPSRRANRLAGREKADTEDARAALLRLAWPRSCPTPIRRLRRECTAATLSSALDTSAPNRYPLLWARLLRPRCLHAADRALCHAAMTDPPTERFSGGRNWPGSQTTVGEHMTAGGITFLPTTTLKEAAS